MEAPADDALGIALQKALEESQVFAVVDAAHFEFLQDTLIAERLNFDPLYLDEIDAPAIASGPQLVKVTGPSQIKKVREIVVDRAACVWWAWPNEPDAGASIFRHLRGLNMVEIPTNRFDADEDEDDAVPALPALNGSAAFETVIFRHADSDVMMTFLPILDADQVARLFGAANAIIVDAPSYQGIRVFDRPDDMPTARRGLLRLDGPGQYDRLADAGDDQNRHIVENYLHDAAPEYTALHTPQELRALVTRAEIVGDKIGFETEHAHGLWAFLALITDCETLTNGYVVRHFQHGDEHPDLMLEGFIHELENASDEELDALL